MSDAAPSVSNRAQHPVSSPSDDYWNVVTPTTSVIKDVRIRREHLPNPSFRDSSWCLDSMSDVPGKTTVVIHFDVSSGKRANLSVPPPEWERTTKRFTYLLINEPAPTNYTDRDFSTAVEWLANSTIKNVIKDFIHFTRWAHERGLTCAHDCTPALLSQYRKAVTARNVAPSRHHQLLAAVERFAFAAPLLPEADRLPMPRWKAADVLRNGRGPVAGSAREVHDPELFGPFLAVGQAMVRVMALDLIAACHTVATWPEIPLDTRRASAEGVLRQYVEEGGIPAVRQGSGRLVLDRGALQAKHHIDGDTLSDVLRARDLKSHLNPDKTVRVPAPVNGLLNDQPWCVGVPWSEAAYMDGKVLLQHLQAACFVVIAYFSGARPDELRTLPIDCHALVPPRRVGGPVLNILEGSKRKRERDAKGAANDAGRPSQWVTIGPGVDAVRVAVTIAELLHENPRYLFPNEDGDGAVIHHTMQARIVSMIEWANATGEREGWPSAYRIPVENAKALRGLSGFRRTGGWFQRDQKDGADVLREQYKHATEVMGDGYASTSQSGLAKLMSRQRREEHTRLMDEVANDLVQGAGVSGPAARRLIAAAANEAPLRAVFHNDREARDIVDEHLADQQPVYDNPDAYSLCVFQIRGARCLSPDIDPEDEPDLVPDRGACQADCGCHARTDRQVMRLQEAADRQRREASSPLVNEPMAKRRLAVADRLQQRIDQHEQTKVFIDLSDVVRTAGEPH